jgi:hypothetical protein
MFGKDKDGTEPSKAIPTGRTIDGEVEPVVFDAETGVLKGAEPQVERAEGAPGELIELPQQQEVLGPAIAQHFGVPVEALRGFVVTAEYETEQGMALSSAWSIAAPVWRLRGFARELLEHLKQAEA